MEVGIDFSHIKSTRLDVFTHGECEVYHADWWKSATKSYHLKCQVFRSGWLLLLAHDL